MSRPVDVSELQHLDLFADLSPELLEQLAAASQLVAYDADTVVFQEGDALPACLHVLVSGQLRVAKVAATGKESILRLLPPGEVFAAPALFGNGRAPATVVAVAPATVLTLGRQALLRGFAQTPDLAVHLLVVFNQRLQELHSRVHGLVSERAIVRLVHYLEHVAAEQGTVAVAEGEELRARLTYYQMARTIGITYEECVRLFKQLQPAASYRRGGRITVADWEHLGELEG
ncbi:MAG: Crp/Fnr family transcriptional regulator [Nodosilinea sp.]